jgi:hypothetical protein
MTFTSPDQSPFLVAICTYHRPIETRRCLESLVVDFAGRPIPVLLLDNCPREVATHELFREFEGQLCLRYLAEPRAGLSIARNTSFQNCPHPFIVYLDDDAKVCSGWTDAILSILDEVKPDLFGGPYKAYYAEEPPKWFRDEYGSAHTDRGEGPLKPQQYISGGNMGWSVEVLMGLGGFPEDLGMIAGAVGLGEETWLQNQAWSRYPNLSTWFSPAMLMVHLVPPYKFPASYWVRREWKAGYQWQRTMENAPLGMGGDSPTPESGLGKAARLLWHLWDSMRILLGYLLRDRKRYPHAENYTVEVVARKVHFWGMFWRMVEAKLRAKDTK